MRIGIICPYSLTLPGGVQMQVLGLARACASKGSGSGCSPRAMVHPDAGVTPLGNSLPTAANGSIAPVAPDPSAQLRVIRAMRDEDFDVIHLHEPLSPGPNHTALLTRPAPLIGTFHAPVGAWPTNDAAGHSLPGGRLDDRCAVSEDAKKMAQEALGGQYDLTFNGVELARFASGSPHPTTAPTIFFLGRHEPRKGLGCCSTRCRSFRPTLVCGSPGRGRRPTNSWPSTPATVASSGSAPSPRPKRSPVCGCRRLALLARWRVVRHRVARGDGRRHGRGRR